MYNYIKARRQVSRTEILANYKEMFDTSKTLKKDYEGQTYMEAHLSDINFNEWQSKPVHFYSDLPIRMEDLWNNIQKRNVKTFIDYVKSLGTNDNPILMLTKVSKRGNRYFTITTKAKYMNMRKRYTNYSVEII